MYEELLKWTDSVKKKMTDSHVKNVAFAIEVAHNQKQAVIINPYETTEESIFNNLNTYCQNREVLAMVWGYEDESGQLKFYQKILQEELQLS